ncbi:hypothetical protein ACHWQZ_G015280 [Mnemiopsis leidyi]
MTMSSNTISRRGPSMPARDMLSDLQGLDKKIGGNELFAEKISRSFSSLEAKIEAMKQYRSNMEEMNSQAGQRPKADLVKRSQTAIYENRKIRELVIENNDLKCALAEHQEALEFIMAKYRMQMTAFMTLKREQSEELPSNNEKILQHYVEKMGDLIAVSDEGIRRDEDYDLQNERELARLRYENRYLRECLKIGRDFGSIPPEENKSQT